MYSTYSNQRELHSLSQLIRSRGVYLFFLGAVFIDGRCKQPSFITSSIQALNISSSHLWHRYIMNATHARLNTYYSQKRQLLGNHGHVAPAWKTNLFPSGTPLTAVGKGKQPQSHQGSKIFLSRLPSDVLETEVEELFRKTIGPVKDSFLVFNSQGKSKGMAVVTFQRSGDAAVAKTKYNGKMVDGTRPLKIEIITDSMPAPMGPPPTPSLLNRLSMSDQPNTVTTTLSTKDAVLGHTQRFNTQQMASSSVAAFPRRRQKKGPKRLKKLQPSLATKVQLDRDMDDYRAAADV